MLEKLICVISLCLPLILELVKPILELVTAILEVDLTYDLPLILELLTPFFESGVRLDVDQRYIGLYLWSCYLIYK